MFRFGAHLASDTVMQIPWLFATCVTASLLLPACGDDSNSKMPANLIASGIDAGDEDAGKPELCAAGDAPVTITKTSLDGSLLTLQLEFGGGCKAHSFSIGWSGVIGTSDPPHIPLEINHYGNDDPCRAVLSEGIVIDLSSIESAFSPAWIDLVDPKGKVIVGATSILYEGPKDGETIPDDALKVRRECAHATF